MSYSSSVGLLAFVLCLFACVSVSVVADNEEGDAGGVNKDTAQQAVETARNSIKEVSEKAQSNINNATLLLKKVDTLKQQANEASTQAQAEKDNENAKIIVANIKRTSDTVSSSYQNAVTQLKTANISMVELLAKAKTMEEECNKVIPTNDKESADYTEENNQALGIKARADGLNTEITDASTIISGVVSTANDMEKSALEAQMKNLHVNVVVAVAKIEKMITEVDRNIEEAENKKDEVNDIVEQMNKHCTPPYAESNTIIKPLCDSAKEVLTNAKGAVEKAKKAKEDIGQQKQPANTALQHLQETKEVSEEQNEVTKAKQCVAKVKEIEDQLETALDTANNAVTNANELKNKLLTALSTTTIAPSTEQSTETKKSDISVEVGKEPHQKDATIQPTSKELHEQSDISADKLKDALIKSAQNVPTTALTGGKAPAPGAKNDSAVTVSVPLLVALIASAVLQ